VLALPSLEASYPRAVIDSGSEIGTLFKLYRNSQGWQMLVHLRYEPREVRMPTHGNYTCKLLPSIIEAIIAVDFCTYIPP
jgi:hypothetical protein